MIFKNVHLSLVDALKKSNCFLYPVMCKNNCHILAMPAERILAIYQDIIVIYNMDKSIILDDNIAADVIPFKVTFIDDYNHIITNPMPIPEQFIDMIRQHSTEVLAYLSDTVCEAISLALLQLANPVEQRDFVGGYLSSFNQFPSIIQKALCNLPESAQHFTFKDPYAKEYQQGCYMHPSSIKKDEYVVSHEVPMEEIYARFEPASLGDRGRAKIGWPEGEPLPLDEEIPGTRPEALPRHKGFQDPHIKAVLLEPTRVGKIDYCPALVQIVDIATEEERNAKSPNQNPIGKVEEEE